jgi:Na+/melibiose symporter-like transporter
MTVPPVRILPFAAVNFVALGALAAPAVAAIPVAVDRLAGSGDRAGALAAVVAWGAVAALVANPVFGFLSDRTRSRWGRRRPWMLGGAVAGLAAAFLLSSAPTVALMAVAWVAMQVSYNAVLAAVAALLSDVVPEEQRPAASGIFSAAAFLGAVPPLALAALFATRLDLVVLAMPILAVVVVALCCLLVREGDVADAGTAPSADAGAVPEAPPVRGFAALWMLRLLQGLGFSLVASFTLYLVVDRMGRDAAEATPVASMSTLVGGAGVVVGALVAGFATSRRGNLLPFLALGGIGLAAAAALRALATDPGLLWVAAAVGGFAAGVFLSASLTAVLRTVPHGAGGRYLGILNVAETLPQVAAPLIAAALVRVGGGDAFSDTGNNYTLLFVVAGGVSLASLLLLPLVRVAAQRQVVVADQRVAEEAPR